MTEHAEQAALIDWCIDNLGRYPSLHLIHAIPNGVMLGGGRVGAIRMNNLKAEGLRPGVSDLFLPVARGGYFGMYIEMKAKGGSLSENQREFIAAAEAEGYYCCVPFSAGEAIENVEWYMQQSTTSRIMSK